MGIPHVPRLVDAIDRARERAESEGRTPDEVDLLDALAEQTEAVAGKALSIYSFAPSVQGDGLGDGLRRSSFEVLRDSEEFAAADGSFFLATEHVLHALLRPESPAWRAVAKAGIDPRLVRSQSATEASELARPTETAETRSRASGIAAPWARGATTSSMPPGSSIAEHIAERLAASDAILGLAVITHSSGKLAIAVRGTTDPAGTRAVGPDTPFRVGSLTKVLTAL